MVNVNKLKGKIIEKGLTISKIADLLDMDRATLYRRINNNGEEFSIKEANSIAFHLELSLDEINEIFFAHYVAYNANNETNQDN